MTPFTLDTCATREPGQPHCWHHTNRVATTYPLQDIYVCCYCGREHFEPQQQTAGYPLFPPGHGPHAPQTFTF